MEALGRGRSHADVASAVLTAKQNARLAQPFLKIRRPAVLWLFPCGCQFSVLRFTAPPIRSRDFASWGSSETASDTATAPCRSAEAMRDWPARMRGNERSASWPQDTRAGGKVFYAASQFQQSAPPSVRRFIFRLDAETRRLTGGQTRSRPGNARLAIAGWNGDPGRDVGQSRPRQPLEGGDNFSRLACGNRISCCGRLHRCVWRVRIRYQASLKST
jgi:hypothetical protein